MPKIIEITAGAATSFNHPYESYANFKPSITLKAVVGEAENAFEAIVGLQKQAQTFVDHEKERILSALKREHKIERYESLVTSLQLQVSRERELIADGPEKLKTFTDDSWDYRQLRDEIDNAHRRLPEAEAELEKARESLTALRAS